jgi:hypothetical protein
MHLAREELYRDGTKEPRQPQPHSWYTSNAKFSGSYKNEQKKFFRIMEKMTLMTLFSGFVEKSKEMNILAIITFPNFIKKHTRANKTVWELSRLIGMS